MIYRTLIRPFVIKHEGTIGQMTSFASEAAKDVGGSGGQHTHARTHTASPSHLPPFPPVMGAVKTAASNVDAQTLLDAKAKFDELADKKDD